ncbi:MAG: hypothetical protein ACO1SV_25245 [Fimbriimonas sp.]
MRRRTLGMVLMGVATSLLAVGILLRPGSPEPYRPQFVGNAPLVERHREWNRYIEPGKVDVYRVPSDFDSLFTRADTELAAQGWVRTAKSDWKAAWRLRGPDGDHQLSIGAVRELERRSKRPTSAPRDGRPYVLVLVQTPEHPRGIRERLFTEGPAILWEGGER